MSEYLFRTLQFIVLVLLAPWLAGASAAITEAQPGAGATKPMNAPAERGIYSEDFTSYAVKDYTDGVKWDLENRCLELLQTDAVPQGRASVAQTNSGGYLIAWKDSRSGYPDVYVQRLNANGDRLWSADLRVSADVTVGAPSDPQAACSSDGECIVTWTDSRTGHRDVYAQRVDLSGRRLWPHDLSVSADVIEVDKSGLDIASDNAGHFIVVWSDKRNDSSDSIYAQRLDLDGRRLWSTDVVVNRDTTIAGRSSPTIGMDNHGDAVIAWLDWRNRSSDQPADIYVQRIGPAGDHRWAADVRANTQGAWAFHSPAIAVTPLGDAVIAWTGGYYYNIYAHRMDANGNAVGTYSLQVNTGPNWAWNLDVPQVAADAHENAIVVWSDNQRNIRAQKLDVSHSRTWTSDTLVNQDSGSGRHMSPSIALEQSDSALIAWLDERLGISDIYAQALDQNGARLLPVDTPVNNTSGTAIQYRPAIRTDATGHLTVAWVDWRNARGDVYIQRFDQQGNAQWLSDVQVVQGPQDGYGLAVDANGNSTVVWSTEVDGLSGILAQQVDSHGNKLWATARQINRLTDDARYPVITTAPNDRFLVAWFASGVYVQSLDIHGNSMWLQEKRINGANNDPSAGRGLQIAANRNGRATIAWQASQNSVVGQLSYAQAIDAGGNRLWSDDVLLTLNGESLGAPSVAVDQSGNTYLAWNTTTWNILAQKLDTQGERAWAADVQVNSDSGYASTWWIPQVALDLMENPLIVWSGYWGQIVYAQKLGAQGTRLWSSDLRVSADGGSSYEQSAPSVVVTSNDSAFIAWDDVRLGNLDVFVQGINRVSGKVWPVDMQVVLPDRFYFPVGAAQSRTVDAVSGDIREAILTAAYQTNGGGVQFALTNNGGADWFPITPGVTHIFTTTGSDLRWRAELTADPLWPRTPVINSLRIEYSTQVPYADDYESDDACVTARPIAINGVAQSHTFHQQADADWVWFDATAGTTYVIQTANTQTNADTVLELHDVCANPPLRSDDNAFGSTAQITWQATTFGRFYVKVANHDPALFGAQTGYDLSVRTVSRLPVAVIVAGHDDSYRLQANINYAADMAYRAFLNSGVPKANLRYFSRSGSRDVDGNGKSDDIFGPPYPTEVRAAIQDWARERGVALGVPFYLVLADHGDYDQFLADGTAGKIVATDLDLWLSNLEATTGTDNINVIIEACRSGSFIDATALGPAEISGRNRVVIASTSSLLNAYAHEGYGAYFSDAFWTGLGEGNDLKTAFSRGKQAVLTTGLSQEPWLDDNGDAIADDRDGALASARGVGGAFVSPAPTIDWATLGPVRQGTAALHAQVRDEFRVMRVWAEIYAPNFVEPPPAADGSTPELRLPIVTLAAAGNNRYAATYTGFTQPGLYRVVVYAQDDDGNQALPVAVSVSVKQGGVALYLPLVFR